MKQDAIIKVLSSKSVTVTRARVHILDFLLHSKGLRSLSEVLNKPGKKFNRVTVYRTLVTLCEVGLIYKIIDSNSKPFYMINFSWDSERDKMSVSHKEYYHFLCESCGQVISQPYGFSNIKLPRGFKKSAVNLFLTGYCPKCSDLPIKKVGVKN